MEKKFCEHCGAAMEPDDLFCPSCGQKIIYTEEKILAESDIPEGEILTKSDMSDEFETHEESQTQRIPETPEESQIQQIPETPEVPPAYQAPQASEESRVHQPATPKMSQAYQAPRTPEVPQMHQASPYPRTPAQPGPFTQQPSGSNPFKQFSSNMSPSESSRRTSNRGLILGGIIVIIILAIIITSVILAQKKAKQINPLRVDSINPMANISDSFRNIAPIPVLINNTYAKKYYP